MLGNIGLGEFLLIAVVALLIFGPNKLPELGRALGRTIREFKQGAQNLLNDEPEQPQRKDVTPPQRDDVTPEQPQQANSSAASSSLPTGSGSMTPPPATESPAPGAAANSRSNPRRLPD